MARSLFFAVALALCLFECCSAQKIYPVSPNRRPFAPKATTEGITDCGVGTLEDVRVVGCAQAPCSISSGQAVRIESDFRPRDHHWIMRYAMIAHQEGQLLTINPENAVPDSILEPGQLYTFTSDFSVSPSFKGLSYIRLELHENWAQELCLIIPVNFV